MDGFIVVYPYDNDELHPGPVAWGQSVGAVWQPDAANIAAMTRATMASYRIDPQRVYEAGFSAGGIITSDVGATNPDLYAAIGVMSGAPYAAFGACETGQDPAVDGVDPQLDADSYGAYRAEGRHARVMPVFVFNGDADTTVNPLCDQLATEQWLSTDNLVIDGRMGAPLRTVAASDAKGQDPGGDAYDVYDYREPSGCLIAQHWIVHGMGHALSGTQYTDAEGPSEAGALWAFLSRYTLRSTSRPCAEVGGSRADTSHSESPTEHAPTGPTPASPGARVQQAASPANTLKAYRNEVSIAYLPTSGACFNYLASTPGCLAYSSAALQAAGAAPGTEVSVGGFDFQWPDTSSGQPDSASPAGQTIPVHAPPGTNTVAILGAAEQGQTTSASYTVVDLHYSSGRNGQDTDFQEVLFPNWDGLLNNTSTTAATNELRTNFAVLNSTVPIATPASVYAVTVPVDPTRQLVSVAFPDTDPSIRMFDLQTATTGK
jgi:poly(3-hydroxybutyrate) depolymerase